MPLFSYKKLKDFLIPLLGIIIIWFTTKNRNDIDSLTPYPIVISLIGAIGIRLNKTYFTLIFEDITRSLLLIVGSIMLFIPDIKPNWEALAIWCALCVINIKRTKILERFSTPILLSIFLLYNTFNTWMYGYTERDDAFEKSLASIITMLLMLCTARRGDERVLLWTFGLVITIPILIGAVYLHKWETFFVNSKNYYAGMGLLSIAMLLSQKKLRFWVLAVPVSICTLINPSATGQAGTIAIWGIFSVGILWQCKNPLLKKISIILVSISIGTCLFLKDVILAVLGKDETLTGRTKIWESTQWWIKKNPINGWGVEFWRKEGEVLTNNATGWGAPHGHSTYLDSLITGGIVSLILLLTIILSSAYSSKKPLLGMILLLCGPGISFLTESRGIPFYISWVTLCLFCGISYTNQPKFPSNIGGLTNSPQ
jgi:O-antigen ligase